MSRRQETESPVVPLKYAGLWIAWDHDETKIVASGRTFDEVRESARVAGVVDPVFAKVPKYDVRFVGKSV